MALSKIEDSSYSIVQVRFLDDTLRCPLTTEEWKTAWHSYSSYVSLTDLGSNSEEFKLPRKEVIQPHLPVRLPCYDFTPITDPTLDVCLSEELARRLQVLPTFVV
jgi:hypothetical protein